MLVCLVVTLVYYVLISNVTFGYTSLHFTHVVPDKYCFATHVVEIRLVKVVVEVMGDVFPELKHYEEHIVDTIAAEEKSFGRTLVNVSLSLCHWIYLYIALCLNRM